MDLRAYLDSKRAEAIRNGSHKYELPFDMFKKMLSLGLAQDVKLNRPNYGCVLHTALYGPNVMFFSKTERRYC